MNGEVQYLNDLRREAALQESKFLQKPGNHLRTRFERCILKRENR